VWAVAGGGGGGGGTWGSITGTLSDQTDLQSALDGKQPLDADLTALAALVTTGMVARTGAGTVATRTITGTPNQISISNGDGVSGNPTISIPTNPTLPGTTTGTFSGNLTGNVTGNADTATALATARGIYGNNFDGTAALTQIIASTYGGTGNGFTKFSGPATSEKTFTLPNANATLLYDGGPLGTPSGGTLTNATGLPISSGVSGLGAGVADFLGTPSSANLRTALTDETGSGAAVFAGSPTITTPTISGAISFPDDVSQVFNPGTNNSGLNVGAIAGDPATPVNGDIWYDSTANELTARINGANVALGAGGGGSPGGSGTELQYRGGASTFSALANSSVPNAGELLLATTPAASATRAVLTVGTAAIAAGSANGNMLGINAPSGFNGNLVQAETNGSTKFKVTSEGELLLGGATDLAPFSIYATATTNPYFAQVVIKPVFDGDSAVALESRRSSITQRWFFGSGSGDGHNNFRIVNLTAGSDALNIVDSSSNVIIGGGYSGNYKLTVSNSGSAGTIAAFDSTATTGTTKVLIQNGQGQSTTAPFEIRDYNATLGSGTLLFRISSAGVIDTGTWNGTALTSTYLPAATVYNNQANTFSTGAQVFTAASLRIPNSTTLPGTCTVGDIYFDTDATAGQNQYGCTATNIWTLQGDGGGGGSPGGSGTELQYRGGASTFSAVSGSSVSGANVVLGGSLTATFGNLVYNDNSFALGVSIKNTNTGTTALTGFELQDSSSNRKGQVLWIPSNYVDTLIQNSVQFASLGTAKLGIVSGVDDTAAPDIYFQTRVKKRIYINGSGSINIGQTALDSSVASTSLYVSDRTTTTGDTRVAIEGGAGQAADLFAVFAYNATPLAGTKHAHITSAGVLTLASAPVFTALTGLVDANGSSAATAITSSTVGHVLRVTGPDTFAFGAVDLADTDAVTGTLPGSNVQAASTTVAGVSELAIDTEVTTGTDATRAVTPDSLAGSTIFGTKVVEIEIYGPGVSASTGDGKTYFYIPPALNGMNLVGVRAQVYTAGTTNTLNVDIARCVAASTGNICSSTVADVLSTNLTIDSAENASDTAATAAVIDTANDDVATGQVYRFDIDAVHTTPSQGLLLILTFQLP
jgi:hypothetical protein